MAKIKCRATIPYCEFDRHKRLFHDAYWFCDSDDGCDIGRYTRPTNARECNPICIYCEDKHEEFEKNVNSYEYDGDLKIGKKTYRACEIDYLEIDGRVLVEEGTE